jgi:phenylalanyl-tRNA synthetase beta chain
MKISRNWLQKYFEKPVPDADKLAELFMFHSFEIESVEEVKNDKGRAIDSVTDAKVLPDRAHYCLSHKGIAGEVSILTKQPIKDLKIPNMSEALIKTKPSITIKDSKFCRRYVGRYVENITIGESPVGMRNLLAAVGQRAINSIVDATNFCMFNVGQPLHAFDADKVEGKIIVRAAKKGEKIILLDGVGIVLSSEDFVIADEKGLLAIAGVKGGKRAEVGPRTKRLIIESANFDPTAVRRTSAKYNLRGESSKRYENEITPELAIQSMNNVCALIKEMNPDAKFGPIVDEYPVKAKQTMIDFDPAYIEERLGVKVPFDEAKNILERMGIIVNSSTALVGQKQSRDKADTSRSDLAARGDSSRSEVVGEGSETVSAGSGAGRGLWNLTIPFERLDLVIREDIVEEIGRIYGYEHIQGILPPKTDKSALILPMYYLSEKIRDILVGQGFSEVSLYTLVEKGDIETAKPLAKNKAFARENLADGMMACVKKNALSADLLGLDAIKIFEIGHVFSNAGERLALSLGVTLVKKIKGQNSRTIIGEALKTLEDKIGVPFQAQSVTLHSDKVCEIDLEEVLKSYKLPESASYEDLNFQPASTNRYAKISQYPFIVRDIAVFVPELIQAENVWQSIEKGIKEASAEKLLIRHSLFDTFRKDEKVSYAFRLIFQSMERTLTDEGANKIMEKIYRVMKERGWEVR